MDDWQQFRLVMRFMGMTISDSMYLVNRNVDYFLTYIVQDFDAGADDATKCTLLGGMHVVSLHI